MEGNILKLCLLNIFYLFLHARVEGTHIIVVSVGTNIRQVELDAMASSPAAANKFAVDSVAQLPTLTDALVQATCDGKQ